MARKKLPDKRIFNKLKRPKLLRQEISGGETVAGVLLLVAIVGMSFWLHAQRDEYDPGERDIDTAVLVAQSVEDDLYKVPLKRWRDPSLGAGSAAPVDLGPLDPSLLAGGWRSTSTPHIFDDDTLYEKINGQAEQYRKFGFEKLTVIELANPGAGRTLDVFLYDQGTFEGCLGVYEEQRGGRPVVESDGVYYTKNPLGAIGMSGRIFFHAIGDTPDPTIDFITERVVKAIGDFVGTTAPGIARSEFIILNRGLGAPFEDIAYQPTNVFQYRFCRNFWFARIDDAENARLFVHAAGSAAAARELFEKLTGELLQDYSAVESEAPGVMLKHDFLKTFFGLRCQGEYVFGVEKHPRLPGAILALDRLQGVLEAGGPATGSSGESNGETSTVEPPRSEESDSEYDGDDGAYDETEEGGW